jgi:hypothetical protein
MVIVVLHTSTGDSFRMTDEGHTIIGYDYPTEKSILLRTDRVVYDAQDSGYMMGILANLSSHPIEVKAYEPLVYELHEWGWGVPFYFDAFFDYYPPPYERGQVQPRGVLPINMDFFLTKEGGEGFQSWALLELPYFYEGREYVVYSNEFTIDQSERPPRFRSAPAGLVDRLSLQVELVEPYVVYLDNTSDRALWFNPFCSDVILEDSHDYPLYAVLQRQTDEATWQVLRPDRSNCVTATTPIPVGAGETVKISLEEGYQTHESLDAGIYRWHLVLYLDLWPECSAQNMCHLDGVHLFTGTFVP